MTTTTTSPGETVPGRSLCEITTPAGACRAICVDVADALRAARLFGEREPGEIVQIIDPREPGRILSRAAWDEDARKFFKCWV